MIRNLTETTVDALWDEPSALVWFTAPWCAPCASIAPVIGDLAESVRDVSWWRCDVQDNPGCAAQFSIRAVPTFVALSRGRVVGVETGASRAAILRLLREVRS